MSGINIETVVNPVELGEGPHWNPKDQSLLFIDIMGGDVHRFFPKTKRHQVLHVEDGGTGHYVTLVLPVEGVDDAFIVTVGRSVAFVKWSVDDPDHHTTKPIILCEVDKDGSNTRFNDGKADPMGRLWAGTMALETSPGVLKKNAGSLFLKEDTSTTVKIPNVSISNGLAWSHDLKTFYYIDSLEYAIHAYDYDNHTGNISNKRTILDYKKDTDFKDDIPDGMTIDADGNLWVAHFFGQKVICIDVTRMKIIQQVELPARNITSVCWGGEDYKTLYVTSSTTGTTPEELQNTPCGATFAITGLSAKGVPAFNYKATPAELKLLMKS